MRTCLVTPRAHTGSRGRAGTYGSPPAGVLVATAVAGGGLAQEVLVGPVAAQAPVAAGTAVGDRLGREQTGGWAQGWRVGGTAGTWVCPAEAQFREALTNPGPLGKDEGCWL